MANQLRWALVSASTLLASACEVPASTSDLHPEGAPVIRQVFLKETGNASDVLGFGWHPDVPNGRDGETADLTHHVDSAAVSAQRLRVVFDELLIGNNLEEISCRDGSYARVPLGATPDDIANCAVADDVLPALCKGEHAVCLRPDGTPIGVLDKEPAGAPDGAADDIRLIAGAVTLKCGSITVNMNQDSSFWQPAGNQLVPAGQRPSNSLGPAVILVPAGGILPSQSTCSLAFASDVTDKQGVAPCAAQGGAEDTDDYGDCTGGDLSAFTFATPAIAFDSSVPSNNSTNSPVTRVAWQILLTGEYDGSSLLASNVTIQEGAGTRTDFTATPDMMGPTFNGKRINIRMAANLLPGTMYHVTVNGLKDRFGVSIAPVMIQFSTAP